MFAAETGKAKRSNANVIICAFLGLHQSKLLGTFVDFEPKNPRDVDLSWLRWFYIRISHQKEMRKCCPEVSSINICICSQGT
jgi:hypothetical protein